ncbi:MAG: protein-glutamine glutaminase family protein [Bdellovibrionota bacterium]
MRASILLLFLLFSINSIAMPAARPEGVDFRKVRDLYMGSARATRSSANSVSTRFENLDLSKIPDWKSIEVTMAAFRYLRDRSFIIDPNNGRVLRRSSWLYPQDGCFARAHWAAVNVASMGLEPPMKFFIFGNLNVKTPFSKSGSVSWWYHVAPIVRVGKRVFVLDPAMEMNHPLDYREWAARQVKDARYKETTFSICSPNTYVPNSNCENEQYNFTKMATNAQLRYLSAERSNLKNLGYSLDMIKDKPPWYFNYEDLK